MLNCTYCRMLNCTYCRMLNCTYCRMPQLEFKERKDITRTQICLTQKTFPNKQKSREVRTLSWALVKVPEPMRFPLLELKMMQWWKYCIIPVLQQILLDENLKFLRVNFSFIYRDKNPKTIELDPQTQLGYIIGGLFARLSKVIWNDSLVTTCRFHA